MDVAESVSNPERGELRRVRRDASKEELVQQLCDPKTGYFSEIWRLLLFAALLGKAKGRREPLKKVETGKSFPASYFSASPLWPGIVHLFGLTEGNTPDCLKANNWDESLKIFEEYANGGLAEIEHQPNMLGILEMLEVPEQLFEDSQSVQDLKL